MAFVQATSYGGIGLAMVFYLKDHFGVTASIVGLSTALQWGGYLAGTILLQPLTRTLLPRYSLIISGVAAAGLTFLVAQSGVLWLAMFAYAGVGFSNALFWPPIMGWVSAGAEGAQLNRRISGFNMSWSLGVIVGPSLAGLLTERGPRLPIYAGAAGFAIVAVSVLVVSIFMESIRNDPHRDPPRSQDRSVDESTSLRFPSWVGMFGAYTVLGALIVVFPIFAREQLLMRESLIGTVLLTRGVASAVGFMVLGRTVAWHFKKVPIVFPIVVLIGAMLTLWASSALVTFAVILPVAGLAISGSYSASVFHGVAGSAERARRMGVHEAILTIGIVAGSFGGGALYQTFGVNTVYLACAILLAVVLVSQSALVLRRTN